MACSTTTWRREVAVQNRVLVVPSRYRAQRAKGSIPSRAMQKPNLVSYFVHEHPQFGLRSDPESSKSFQEPQPKFHNKNHGLVGNLTLFSLCIAMLPER